MNLTADRVAEATGGTILRGAGSVFTSYAIDSRKVHAGALFFALRGTVTDGHLYVRAAAEAGATGALVEEPTEAPPALTLIQVADSLHALQALATAVRNGSRARFIGITGSAGKTSTKEFTAALLSAKYRVYKSEGNLNSITGLPLSLLAMEEPECAVFELGMSEPGEMAGLAALLQPHIRVLLNVNPVHLGQFPSVDAIADEKCSLLKGISSEDVILYNADDPRLTERVARFDALRCSYGFSPGTDLQIADVRSEGVHGQAAVLSWQGSSRSFRTALCGRGNLYNIAAACCAALVCGVSWTDIIPGIEALRPYTQRGLLIPCGGFDVYDDSYNSNPAALKFALELSSESRGYRRMVAVLGDMLELGPREAEFHQDAGRTAARLGFQVLITAGRLGRILGQAAREEGLPEVHEAEDSLQAARIAGELVREGDLVLVKGSRGVKMEVVVNALRQR